MIQLQLPRVKKLTQPCTEIYARMQIHVKDDFEVN